MFSSRFMLFPTLKNWRIFFLEKQFFLISCFMLFSTLKKYIETPVYLSVTFSLLVKWEVVSPNSRSGQLESISMISSIPLALF